jgi:hypothetical protein
VMIIRRAEWPGPHCGHGTGANGSTLYAHICREDEQDDEWHEVQGGQEQVLVHRTDATVGMPHHPDASMLAGERPVRGDMEQDVGQRRPARGSWVSPGRRGPLPFADAVPDASDIGERRGLDRFGHRKRVGVEGLGPRPERARRGERDAGLQLKARAARRYLAGQSQQAHHRAHADMRLTTRRRGWPSAQIMARNASSSRPGTPRTSRSERRSEWSRCSS